MRALVAVVLIVLLFNTTSASVNAEPVYVECWCEGAETPRWGKLFADVVFSGKIVHVIRNEDHGWGWGPTYDLKFKVDKAWKGVSRSEIVDIGMSQVCGHSAFFPEHRDDVVFLGKSYLVYAEFFGDNSLGIDPCGRTIALADAKEEMRALGPHQDQWKEWGLGRLGYLSLSSLALALMLGIAWKQRSGAL